MTQATVAQAGELQHANLRTDYAPHNLIDCARRKHVLSGVAGMRETSQSL